MVRLLETLLITASFYTVVTLLCVVTCRVRDISTLLAGLLISSYGKLFAIPSAMWSQDTNLLILSYILVLANNALVLRVITGMRARPALIIVTGFLVERYTAFKLRNCVWPWDTLQAYKEVAYHSQWELEGEGRPLESFLSKLEL